MKYAPIIVFGYNRADHLEKTLAALQNNVGAEYSDVFLFLDGSRDSFDQEAVEQVYEVAKKYKINNSFKSFSIEKQKTNIGLAASVINGVSKIMDEYKCVIVLEDDIVTSRDFLEFMNGALRYYKNNAKIWSISGFTFELPSLKNIKEDVYLGYRASSWGWATWSDRWEKVDWEVKDYCKFRYRLRERHRFNRGGTNMANMLDRQIAGEIDSWAIRWCYAQYKQDMLTVFPCKSKVINIGLDGSGTHCTTNDIYNAKEFGENSYKLSMPPIYPQISKEFSKRTSMRLRSRIKRYVYYNIIKRGKE